MPWHLLSPTRYRIFHAEPLLALDLGSEIKWHQRHLKHLKKQAQRPNLFHEHWGYLHKTPQERERHFQEHVLEQIPYHSKRLADHIRRRELITAFFSPRAINDLRGLASERGAFPDYLVYDKERKSVFFLNKNPTTAQQIWAHEVQAKKLATVKSFGDLRVPANGAGDQR